MIFHIGYFTNEMHMIDGDYINDFDRYLDEFDNDYSGKGSIEIYSLGDLYSSDNYIKKDFEINEEFDFGDGFITIASTTSCPKGHHLFYKERGGKGRCIECSKANSIKYNRRIWKEGSDRLHALAVGVPSFEGFWSEVQEQRCLDGKPRFKEGNEVMYQHLIFHYICTRFKNITIEMERQTTDRVRPDIIIESHKIIIEAKTVASNWQQYEIDDQLAKYRERFPDYTVLGTHVDGMFGLLTFDQLKKKLDELIK